MIQWFTYIRAFTTIPSIFPVVQVENKTEEVREMTERIWNIFKRTDQSIINSEVVTSNRLSRETSIQVLEDNMKAEVELRRVRRQVL